ncbi:TPA: hypothetical protein EYO57_10330 [Candidatus Poribacteria bacterium]|nr:hypothetical protein [Candidatus Poribacteria bacterium]
MENTLIQIRESRKRIALAWIEMNQSSSIADSSGNAGQESGTDDVQGEGIQSNENRWTPNKKESAIMQGTSTQARLDGGFISFHNTSAIDFKLNAILSDR